MKLNSVKLNALVEHNDELIAKLDKLRVENEREDQLFKDLQNWSYRLDSGLIPPTELPEVININDALEMVCVNAATVIQRAYRKHLYKVENRRRAQRWATVSSKDIIKFIDVISKRISQGFTRPKFEMMQWKDELQRFEENRTKRAACFEERSRLIQSLKQERRFIETRDPFTADNKQLTSLKPYLSEKAVIELQWQLECAETEALINS